MMKLLDTLDVVSMCRCVRVLLQLKLPVNIYIYICIN